MALTVALAALALPGCGGDEDGVSRENYAQRMSKVCDKVERQLNALDTRSAETPAQVGRLIDQAIIKSEVAVDRLQALERPTGDARDAADRFVNSLQREFEKEALPALEELKEAIRSGDRKAIADAADRLGALENADSDRFARELGADACAA